MAFHLLLDKALDTVERYLSQGRKAKDVPVEGPDKTPGHLGRNKDVPSVLNDSTQLKPKNRPQQVPQNKNTALSYDGEKIASHLHPIQLRQIVER